MPNALRTAFVQMSTFSWLFDSLMYISKPTYLTYRRQAESILFPDLETLFT